jgi:serine/threonine protein kinase
MVLQYADGGNLRDYLKNLPSPLTWPNKYRIALEIAEGLLWLHAEGVIHRDLVKFIVYEFIMTISKQ